MKRRTPLRPGKPLARGPGPKRRSPLRPVSDKRIDEGPERDRVEAFVFYRDELRCRMEHRSDIPPCMGVLTVQHIRKAGQGGPYVPLNLVTVCAFHNSWLETAEGARWGERHGLVARAGDDLIVCWARMREFRIVTWNHAGE